MLSDQEKKSFEERFILFLMKNVNELSSAKFEAISVPNENEIFFTFGFGKSVLRNWFKFFPETVNSVENKLGRKLEL